MHSEAQCKCKCNGVTVTYFPTAMNYTTKESISDLLKKCLEDESIEIVDVVPACKEGENFVAILKRIHFISTTGNNTEIPRSIILKVPPPADAVQNKLVDCRTMFNNEVSAYKHIMPALHQTTEKLPLPHCFYADSEVILMEDLTPNGYSEINRKEGFNKEELIVALKAIAIYQAQSLILRAKSKERFEEITKHCKETVFSDRHIGETTEYIWENYIWVGLESLRRSEDKVLMKAAQELSKFQGQVMLTLQKLTDCDDSFKVLCHGDLWSANILLKRNDMGQPNSACLVDLQTIRTGSCVLDILHVVCSSAKAGILGNHFNDLLAVYYTVVSDIMSRNNLTPPFSFQQLIDEVKRKSMFGIFLGLIMIQCTMNSITTQPHVVVIDKKALQMEETKIRNYNGICQRCHSRIRQMVRDCVEAGILQLSDE